MAKKSDGVVQVKVRMPQEMHKRLDGEAARGGQTLNGEILRRIEMSFQNTRELVVEATATAVKNTMMQFYDPKAGIFIGGETPKDFVTRKQKEKKRRG